MIQWSECSIVFHCFENPTVLYAIQSWFSDQNVPLSSHCFENPTVLHAIQSWSSDQNVPLSFHYLEHLTVLHAIQLLIVLKYFSIYAMNLISGWWYFKGAVLSELYGRILL
jgi:hypothetical protein